MHDWTQKFWIGWNWVGLGWGGRGEGEESLKRNKNEHINFVFDSSVYLKVTLWSYHVVHLELLPREVKSTKEATLKCVFFFLLLLGAKQTSWRPKKSGGANDAKDIFWGKKWATSRPSSCHIMKDFLNFFFLEVVIFRELISTCCQKLFRRNPKSFSTFLFHM
jgi:hypothetical protein